MTDVQRITLEKAELTAKWRGRHYERAQREGSAVSPEEVEDTEYLYRMAELDVQLLKAQICQTTKESNGCNQNGE